MSNTEYTPTLIRWHKYEDEKPSMEDCPAHSRLFGSSYDDMHFLCLLIFVDSESNPIQSGWVYDCIRDCFVSDEGFELDRSKVIAWAYLPAPPKEESCKS